jgi:hypothetical protein
MRMHIGSFELGGCLNAERFIWVILVICGSLQFEVLREIRGRAMQLERDLVPV